MVSEKQKQLVDSIKSSDLSEYRNLYNLLQMALNIYREDNSNLTYCLKISKFVKEYAPQLLIEKRDSRFDDLYWQAMLFEAPHLFDSYCLYIERNRLAHKRFYQPRRKVLKVLADDLQDLADRKIYFLGISLPPRVGKSTLCIFFMTWLMGRDPEVTNAMAGHSDTLTKGFYTELLSVINDRENYCWHDIFPASDKIVTSARDETVDTTGKSRRYATCTCRGVLATWTGAVDISNGGCLYCDDLVEDLEESLNIARLDKKYDAYLNQLRDRMKDDSFELMVGTRWSVLDPLGRIKEKYEDNPKYRFRVIPALDENEESNFQYDYGVGFSTEFYLKTRDDIDDATWYAKYMGQPYVREGILFPRDSLQYYNGILPGTTPDMIISGCDVAWGGGDFVSAPVAYIFGNDVYIHDVAYSNGNKDVTQPIVSGVYIRNNVNKARFEANNGGDEYASSVDELMRKQGYRMNVSSAKTSNQSSKMAKIIQYTPDIMKFHFLDNKKMKPEELSSSAASERKYRDEAYQKFMNDLTIMVMESKGNKHDDSADSLRILCEFMGKGDAKVQILDRRKLGI